jgi:pimeloyl-ACP methyl ester carboxylesterase
MIFAASIPLSANTLSTPSNSGFCEVNGGNIYYEVFGEGFPLVMIHDGLVHSEVWDAQVTAFSGQYRIIRYDRRGYGKSEQPTAPYSNIEDLFTLLISHNVDHAIIMGSSAGGGLAIDFALTHPEMVEALILAGPVINGLGYSFHFSHRGYANYNPDLDTKVENWINDKYSVATGNPDARKRVRELLKANPHNLDNGKYQFIELPDQAALDRLSEIKVPTLLVNSDGDIPDVHAHAGAIEAGIKGTRRVVISGGGHLIYLEQPEAFNAEVGEFLSIISLPHSSSTESPWNSFERGFAPVNGSVLYYEVMGQGQPVVLIHGGLLDHRMWDDQFSVFAENYRVIRYDVRGHGLSPDPYGDRRDCDDLRDLLVYLGEEKAHIIGLSLGGAITIDFALEHPDMVLSIIPVSSGLSGYEFTGELVQKNMGGLREAYFDGDYHKAADCFQRSWTDGPFRNPEDVPKAVRGKVHAMAYENIKPGKTNGRVLIPDPPAIGRLAEIKTSTMIILGELDMPGIHDITDRIMSEVPGARKVTLSDVAHNANMEDPSRFNSAVLEFLEQ